jgi:hypothetical protein
MVNPSSLNILGRGLILHTNFISIDVSRFARSRESWCVWKMGVWAGQGRVILAIAKVRDHRAEKGAKEDISGVMPEVHRPLYSHACSVSSFLLSTCLTVIAMRVDPMKGKTASQALPVCPRLSKQELERKHLLDDVTTNPTNAASQKGRMRGSRVPRNSLQSAQ